MSHLVEKYVDEFNKDYNVNLRDRYYSRGGISKLVDIGRQLVITGTHKLPSLKKEGLFLEKYRRGIKAMLEYLGLPGFIELKFREDKPYDVTAWFEVQFEDMLKYDGEIKDSSKYMEEVRNFISSFLGIDFGSPAHGNLQLRTGNTDLIGVDEWIKNVFNKDIKKRIKELPNAKTKVHSVKLTTNNNGFRATIQLTFKRGNWSQETEIKEGTKEIIKSMGYNPKRLQLY